MHYFLLLAAMLHALNIVVGNGITPTAPGPGDKFNAGSPCTIQWEVGENWSNFTISLLSGSNTQMQLVTTVASGLNGSDTSLSPFNWTCPEVDPYSAIYFYQFTNGNDTTNSKWTTRFTIASPSGESSSPANSTQPNGDAISWGIGSLSNLPATTTTIATSSATSGSPSSSSRMRKTRISVTSTERLATPTIVIPSGTTTTDAAATATTFAAYRPNAQNENGARWNQEFYSWKMVVILALVFTASS
ncbi:hypothetical protein F5050DRAFT_1561408 [Lentinula boryana]|uniref:Yeast cell wall synthesis Kre9/Knh1-like N-terminal domain-containing protein n=1 Tax=Lentinula boryana TaxID=40481 RepID=A0ABQ8QRF5_9AGAR|nr:hypothetical protein F5050DRAFT_1561408 [Lentinula boryana]